MRKKLIIILIVFALLISPVSSVNWNTFQGGVTHDGYRDEASDFVTNLWTVNIGDAITSSPAIYKDYIYIVSSEGILKAIDMETGEEEWDIDLESATNSSPIVHENQLYIGCEDGLKAVNINNHEIIWDWDVSDATTATFYEDIIYFGSSDGHLYGLNKDGELKFNKKLDGELKTTPTIVNDTIYIGSTNTKLYSIDIDKSKNWEFTSGDEILSTPAYVNESVIFGSCDGNLYCVNVSDGSVLWKEDLNNKILSSPTVDDYDNNVYVGSDEGNLTCLDIRDGKIKWSYHTGSEIQTTPALKDDIITFGSNNGYLYVLNKFTGKEEFTYNPGTILFNSPITSSAVINGNSLFFGDESGTLYSLNIEKYEVPASMGLYYSLIVLIAMIIVAVFVIRFLKGRI